MADVIEIDAATGEINERDYTAAEKLERKQIEADHLARKAETEAKATAKSAIADRLGLTADELATLLS
jgi:hypothetical protein